MAPRVVVPLSNVAARSNSHAAINPWFFEPSAPIDRVFSMTASGASAHRSSGLKGSSCTHDGECHARQRRRSSEQRRAHQHALQHHTAQSNNTHKMIRGALTEVGQNQVRKAVAIEIPDGHRSGGDKAPLVGSGTAVMLPGGLVGLGWAWLGLVGLSGMVGRLLAGRTSQETAQTSTPPAARTSVR